MAVISDIFQRLHLFSAYRSINKIAYSIVPSIIKKNSQVKLSNNQNTDEMRLLINTM